MKKLFRIDPNPSNIDLALLIARVGVSASMLTHGLPKLMMLFGEGPVQFPGVMGMGPEISLFLAVFAEVLCSILILLGLGTRLAAIPLIVTMVIAVFLVHGADPFAVQEMGLLYLFAYVVFFLVGSGKYSFDALLVKKEKAPVTALNS